jgi:uncharacterized membrane protein YeiB
MELSARRPGPDVVRALAMAGVVVMNYHGYLILRGGRRGDGLLGDLFDPWTGPLSTRFAATFVLTAGVGVTLMTSSSTDDAVRRIEMRWRLVRRGLLLYGGGLLFEQIWPGTILPFYGAMFVLAAVLFTARARWVLGLGAIAALTAWLIRWWRYERELDGHDTRWLTDPGARSPRGLLLDVFVNGTHPLLPWLAFFCTGIVLARQFGRPRWRALAAGTGVVLYAAATGVAAASGDGARRALLLSNDPFDRGVVYVASALGSALVAFAGISWIADRYERSPTVDALRRAGQMSLTIYLAHALVFNLLVDWLDVLRPRGLATALGAAATFWIVATALAISYQRRYGRGPAERVYRRLTA